MVDAGGYALAQAGIIPGGDQTVESALTKLAYLLSKGLPVERVRELVGAPLRGEITSSVPTESAATAATHSEDEDEEETGVEDAFKALVDLSTINLGTAAGVERSSSPAVDFKRPIKPLAADKDPAAGWSTSIHQRQLIHNSLLPHLLALACAQNDHDALSSLLATVPLSRPSSPVIRPMALPLGGQAEEAHGGGIINRADVTQGGRTALHIAALRGSTECVKILLANGALVHLRDDLGFSS
jgi:lysophospholipase